MNNQPLSYHDLARAALGFVLEDETWPVFIEWVRVSHVSGAAHEWAVAPDLAVTRAEWMRHSPDLDPEGKP